MNKTRSLSNVLAVVAVLTTAALLQPSVHTDSAPVTPATHTTTAVPYNPCRTITPIERALQTDTAMNRWGDPDWTAQVAADLSDYAAALGGPAAPPPFGAAAQEAGNLAFATRIISAQDRTGAPTIPALEAADSDVPAVEADAVAVHTACVHSQNPGVSHGAA